MTVDGIARARSILGEENVAALLTLTRSSLGVPHEIIDTYLAQGFRSIFLRPLSPFGFATRGAGKQDYSPDEFMSFYRTALPYLISLNQQGVQLEEILTSLLLQHILTPFASSYVDLRSPCGSGLDTLVYNYDGMVYASDESRMLAEMGNRDYAMGSVHDTYESLMRSPAIENILAGGVAESLPGCSDCVYLPYCGADPVYSVATQGDPIGHRPSSSFCKRQTALFEYLFDLLHEGDEQTMRVLLGWLAKKAFREVPSAGYCH